MTLFEGFGMRYLKGELRPWLYKVWLSVQTVPLFKSENAVRPIGIRNPLLKLFHKEVIDRNKGLFVDFFEPQLLAMSKGKVINLS